MASITAFQELAEQCAGQGSPRRLSLRRAQAFRWKFSGARRERLLALLIVIVIEAAVFCCLRIAMRPHEVASRMRNEPLLITFVLPPRALHPPAAAASVPARTSASLRASPIVHRAARRIDALRAVVLARPATALPAPLPAPLLYGPDGQLLLPPPPSQTGTRDLMAERDSGRMLPGSEVPYRTAIVLDTRSPAKKATDFVSMLAGGGPVDPCPSIAREMVDLDHPARALQAEEHYERSCEGH